MRFTVGQLLSRSCGQWANRKPGRLLDRFFEDATSRHRVWASLQGARPGGIFRARTRHQSAGVAGGGAVLGNHSQVPCPGDRLGAVGGAELAQDVADVLFHRVEGDHQLVRDALVRFPRGD